MGELDEVKADVAGRTAGAGFIERLGERVGGQAGASAVFGDPVEREGVTVIPVAQAMWGFGGGSGEKEGEVGSGGGGGGAVKPLGHIEVRNGSAEFKPLRTGPPPALVAAAAGLAALTITRLTRRI